MSCLVELYLEKEYYRSKGNELRDWRKRLKLSMSFMVQAMNISIKVIRALETGRHIENRDLLYALYGETLNSISLNCRIQSLEIELQTLKYQLADACRTGYKTRTII